MKQLLFTSLCLLSLTSAHAGILTPWKDYSDPTIMSADFERNFSKLPLNGHSSDPQKLWANDYWPRKRGGINYRWNSSNPIGFKLKSPGRAEAMQMSEVELAALAPSEKLDILNARYDYPLKEEVDESASPQAPLWHGICNGWSPASINHNEPVPKTLVNPDGIAVPFGSSDIKALLSYYYAFKHQVRSTHQMGRRCNFWIEPNCHDDLNAGAFHIVLANKVGIDGSSFIADVERKRAVWNHAVNKYTTTIVQENIAPADDSAPGTVRRVRVKTDMSFVMGIKKNSWFPVMGTEDHVDDIRNYEYYLELDHQGNIIGGEWISKARPDFMWMMEKATNFGGMFHRLPELLND